VDLEGHGDGERLELLGRDDGRVDVSRSRASDGGADGRTFTAVGDSPDGGTEDGLFSLDSVAVAGRFATGRTEWDTRQGATLYFRLRQRG
jgi:hypothetical protein